MLKVGDTASIEKIITDSDVRTFADISGDKNPIHLDDSYAASTRFKKRIAHGILTGSLISAVLGMHLPGPGSIYLSQILKFRAPVFIGDAIRAVVKVTDIRESKNIVHFETNCINQDGTTVLEGEAVLLVPNLKDM